MDEAVIAASESEELQTITTQPSARSGSISVQIDGLGSDLIGERRTSHFDHTPEHAVQNFDGTYDVIHARNINRRKCDQSCLNFWLVGGLMIVVAIVSIVLIAVQGLDSTQGRFWQTLLSFAIGVVVPNPKYKRKHRSNAIQRQQHT